MTYSEEDAKKLVEIMNAGGCDLGDLEIQLLTVFLEESIKEGMERAAQICEDEGADISVAIKDIRKAIENV